MSDGKKIAHATMNIHGQGVFLNDNLGNKDKSLDCAVHLIITFKTVDELLACYEILRTDGKDIGTFNETPYSKLCGNFMDKFGVMWGLRQMSNKHCLCSSCLYFTNETL